MHFSFILLKGIIITFTDDSISLTNTLCTKGRIPVSCLNQSYTFTGHQPIKLTLDKIGLDAGRLNTNAIPLFCYAEVLLNFAEAKAELGTLTNQEWALTNKVSLGESQGFCARVLLTFWQQ